VVLLPVPASD
jgi:hypothetical protein